VTKLVSYANKPCMEHAQGISTVYWPIGPYKVKK